MANVELPTNRRYIMNDHRYRVALKEEIRKIQRYINSERTNGASNNLLRGDINLLANKQRELSRISTIGAPVSTNKVEITDHAMLRYIERKYNLDMKVLSAEIITADLLKAVQIAGPDGKYPLTVYGTAVIIGNKIVTII